MRQIACALLLVLISGPISGQVNKPKVAPDKPLSNDDVLAMVGAGVGEKTVIAAIEHAPTETLDTAADAIGQLTKRGVSKAVVDAMVKRMMQRDTAALSAPQAQAQVSAEKAKPRVFVGGVGTAPFLQTVLDDLTDFLLGKKVAAKQIGGETQSRSSYLERVNSAGGENLLYITLDMSGEPWYRLKTQCFEPKGKLLWEDEVKTLGISGGGSGAAKVLLKKLEKVLEPRIGKPCLLVADPSAPK